MLRPDGWDAGVEYPEEEGIVSTEASDKFARRLIRKAFVHSRQRHELTLLQRGFGFPSLPLFPKNWSTYPPRS